MTMRIILISFFFTLSLLSSEAYDKLKIKLSKNTISTDNIWYTKYQNFNTYNKLAETLRVLKIELKKSRKTKKYRTISRLKEQIELKSNELRLLKEYKNSTFGDLMRADKIADHPEVTNPINAISAVSFMQKLDNTKDSFQDNLELLGLMVSQIINRIEVLNEIVYLRDSNITDKQSRIYNQKIKKLERDLQNFEIAKESYKTTIKIYIQRANDLKVTLKTHIQSEVIKLSYIAITIVILILISIFIKMGISKYTNVNDRIYTSNKIVNFTTILIIIMILLFSYLENVSYLVTVLGFASAGIAIAMRDWFMSILGWMVMMIGGSIHVGDRIKVMKDKQAYVGDVLDISMLRITLQEDITYTTYKINRRAGRIIFIPNNFIFSSMISNYSHNGLKTVWDGIDITITFTSNHEKASFIAKEVASNLSKGYTSIARKQLNRLRTQYSLKNTNVETRCFSLVEEYGMRISVWFQTNSFATLSLRSKISAEIVNRFLAEEDIEIAYKTQNLYIEKINDSSMINKMRENEEMNHNLG